MNRTQVFLLIAVLGLASFYMWSKLHKLETTEAEFQKARYYPDLVEEDVSKIKVVSREPSFEYELTNHGGEWFIDSHLLNIEKAHQLVSSLIELTTEREMDANPSPERAAEFGIDEPSYLITVWGKEDKELGSVKLGDRVPDYNFFYGQKAEGGAISTVPAYTLGPLEEEPTDLLEKAFFPVEVATVDRLLVKRADEVVVDLRREGEESFSFAGSLQGTADESRVEKFILKLKDLKVGRFLNEDEKPNVGATSVSYDAKLSFSEFHRITELLGRVPANPSLVYGQRYLRDPKTKEPVPKTLERFVVEIPKGSDAMEPSAASFQDRRLIVFDMDKVTGLTLKDAGKSYSGTKNMMGKWEAQGKQVGEEAVNGLLWVLKDLRYEESLKQGAKPAKGVAISLTVDGREPFELFFSEEPEPTAWRGNKGYKLSENSWKTLSDAVARI